MRNILRMVLLTLPLLSLGQDEIQFEANRLIYSKKDGKIILRDSARINRGNVSLMADSIVLFRNRNLLMAYRTSYLMHIEDSTKDSFLLTYRTPLLILGKDSLRGDSILYNTETEQGVAFNGKSHIERGWLTGEEMYRVSDTVLHIYNGTFTTCDRDTPDYWFSSRKIKVLKDDIAVVSPIVLNISGLPVVALPFWFFPVKKGRKSGFMTPHIGFNSTDGRYIRDITYYWVVNNYMDMSLGLDIIEGKGFRTNYELQYNRYKLMNGRINFSGAQELDPVRRRWNLTGTHSGDLWGGAKLKAQANMMSDINYMQDYSEVKSEWIKSELHSFASITRPFDFAVFSANVDERRDLVTDERNMTIPNVGFNILTVSLGGIQFSENSKLVRKTHSSTDTTWTRYAEDNTAIVTTQIKLLRYFQISPGVSVISTIFDRDKYGRRHRTRTIYKFNTSLSTVLYGMSLFSTGPIEKFRSTIKPSISYNYTPEVDQSYIDPFDVFGVITQREDIRIGISSEYEGKLRNGETVTLATSQISTFYNLLEEEEKLGDINIAIQLLPRSLVNTRVSSVYNWYRKKITETSIITGLKLSLVTSPGDTTEATIPSQFFQVNLTHNLKWIEDIGISSNRLDFSLSSNITQNWRLGYSVNYDLQENKFINQSIVLNRDLHCWQATFRWNKFGETWFYDFKIWIKNLPDVKLKRSFFELLLPEE